MPDHTREHCAQKVSFTVAHLAYMSPHGAFGSWYVLACMIYLQGQGKNLEKLYAYKAARAQSTAAKQLGEAAQHSTAQHSTAQQGRAGRGRAGWVQVDCCALSSSCSCKWQLFYNSLLSEKKASASTKAQMESGAARPAHTPACKAHQQSMSAMCD